MKNTARQFTSIAQALLLVSVFTLVASVSANAQEQSSKLSNIKVKNFGQMTERLYRGAQPEEEDYKELAALGINTIIDLRNDPKSYAKSAAEAAGMRYINLPMSDKKRPQDEQAEEFLKIAKDSATGTMYIHCAGGRHRTGVIGAVYRYNIDGWGYDQVYKEMKAFDYYSRWGHGALGDYVKDYYERIQTNAIQVNSGQSSSNPK